MKIYFAVAALLPRYASGRYIIDNARKENACKIQRSETRVRRPRLIPGFRLRSIRATRSSLRLGM
jgi:hypothetical protein